MRGQHTQAPLGKHHFLITALSSSQPGLGLSLSSALRHQQIRGDVEDENHVPLQEKCCHQVQQFPGG